MEIKKRLYIKQPDTTMYLCVDRQDNAIYWVDGFADAASWDGETELGYDLYFLLPENLLGIPFEIVQINTIIHP